MDEATRDELRALLIARREAVRRRERAGEEALATVADARSFATADDEHDPEGATLSEEWSRVAGLEVEAARELAEIEAALARVESGGYGACEACGTRIPAERLRIRPMATRCVDCAA